MEDGSLLVSFGLCHCILFGYRAYSTEEANYDITDHTIYIGPIVIILSRYHARWFWNINSYV